MTEEKKLPGEDEIRSEAAAKEPVEAEAETETSEPPVTEEKARSAS